MFRDKQKIVFAIMILTAVVVYIKYEAVQREIVSHISDVKQSVSQLNSSNHEHMRLIERLIERHLHPTLSVTLTPTTSISMPSVTIIVPEIEYLHDIQVNESNLQPEKNIFFILSTIMKDGEVKLTPRQACAIESAAKYNPDWSVFALFVSATKFSYHNSSNIMPLLVYPNVYLRRVNMTTYGNGSPVEKLLKGDSLKKSSYIVEHTSDLLRLLTLYKYGGTYMDTDVVVMKSINELPRNYLCSEGDGYVANGIINLQATGYGHTFAEACLMDVAKSFNGTQWSFNGPMLVTRVLKKFCNATETWHMTREKCGGQLSVLPPDTFFQLFYPKQNWYFEEQHQKEVMEKVKGHILTHLWNQMTSGIKLTKDSKVAYVELANECCPNVIRNSKDHF